jgi:hypothetical protein
VLVIVTGGTFTMVHTPNGYVAAPGLADRLRRNIVLSDTKHAKSINLERNWLVTPVTQFQKRIKY